MARYCGTCKWFNAYSDNEEKAKCDRGCGTVWADDPTHENEDENCRYE